jgi:Icc-related predicted phosphoesterase
MIATIAAALLVAAGSFEQYQVDSETTCVGKADHVLAAPETWSASGHAFTASGSKLEVKAEQPEAGVARLGLLSAVKDFSPDTKKNLEIFIAAFKKAGVRAIIVGGDSAYGVDDQDSTIAEVFTFLGDQGIPVYAVIGNSESRSAFNRGALAAWRKNKSVINLGLVRRVEADGFTLVSLPGYFDRRFIAETSGCNYKPEDAQELTRLARGATTPVVLVTHGPPRQDGAQAIDVTTDGKNVGDPDLTQAIADAKIPFGVFGHILEAGGRATDLEGKKPVKQGTPATSLYINPGPAFADPWAMNDGRTSKGMAAILTLKGGKAEWTQVLASAIEKAPEAKKPSKAGSGSGSGSAAKKADAKVAPAKAEKPAE